MLTKRTDPNRATYTNLTWALGLPGIILQIVGQLNYRASLQQGQPGPLWLLLGLVGTGMLITAFAFYAMSKGRNPAWCLMGFLGLIGLIVLLCLREVEPALRKKKKKKRPRRVEDEDDYDDRPQRRRSVNEDDYEEEERSRRRRPREDDDDEDDDRPRRRRSVDEDDYEEEERPRRRRPREDDDDEEDTRPRRRAIRSDQDEPAPRSEQVRAKPPGGVGGDSLMVTCSECEKNLRIPARLAGRKVKCPACNGIFVAQ
jgi:hypothetical protein